MRPGLTFLLTGFLVVAMAGSPTHLVACDCHKAHAVTMGVPSFGGVSIGQPVFGSMAMAGVDVVGSTNGSGYASTFELPLAPTPPGTLGQTYQKLSHPIPTDEHPRTAMLAVRDKGTTPYLSVHNMGGFKMKNGIWLFESSRPLDPGACQIVRVEARQNPRDIEPFSTKFVRLIPGRIVYLDF